jgi:hypothetical protein
MTSIYLGTEERLTLLYSYPNAPGGGGSLVSTVLHWFGLTLERDGLTARGARASVRVEGPDYCPNYFLDLDGPPELAGSFALYATRLPRFLNHGWDAVSSVVPQIQAAGKWDPSPDPPPYRPWRFFMPHGMAMLRQRSLQFFHYPPIRLLETFPDYLNDPVPTRCEELLTANGVPAADLPLFNTVVDATPIAAADDQGSKTTDAQGKPVGDPTWGLIPIQSFHAYQKAQVELLLNTSGDYYTAPIVVYGAHPRDTFAALYDVKLGVNVVAIAEILPGRQTAVIGANHPYVFYAAAQGFATVGSGQFLSPAACQQATGVMQGDLVVTRWQKLMADDPSSDPQAVLDDCSAYWKDPARAPEICALVQHQASLVYSDPVTLTYSFKLSTGQAATLCAAHGNNPCAALTTKG